MMLLRKHVDSLSLLLQFFNKTIIRLVQETDNNTRAEREEDVQEKECEKIKTIFSEQNKSLDLFKTLNPIMMKR